MKVKLYLITAMMVCTLSASAQAFRYEEVRCRASLKSYDPARKDTVYLTNVVKIMLPKSCSNADINLAKINETLLRDVFVSYYKDFSSAELIQKNVSRMPIDEEFESYDWKPCDRIESKNDSKHFSAQLTCTQRGTYKGACFFENYLKIYSGGSHGLISHWTVAIDLKTGTIAPPEYFFSLDEQKAILRMLCKGATVRKYIINDSNLNTDDCNAIADGIKEDLESNDYLFPSFYFDKKRYHILFNQEEIGPYTLGAPELIIPESVITRACQSVNKEK